MYNWIGVCEFFVLFLIEIWNLDWVMMSVRCYKGDEIYKELVRRFLERDVCEI